MGETKTEEKQDAKRPSGDETLLYVTKFPKENLYDEKEHQTIKDLHMQSNFYISSLNPELMHNIQTD